MDFLIFDKVEIAKLNLEETFSKLNTTKSGLNKYEIEKRKKQFGLNTVQNYKASITGLIFRQLNNPILWLLSFALIVSGLLGEKTNSSIIFFIVIISITLGFLTEYRAEKAIADLHSRIKHHATVVREGRTESVEIAELVPGDIVKLRIGSIIPADLKIIEVDGFECDESIITGESIPNQKQIEYSSFNPNLNQAFMGTVVRNGTATAIVVATGSRTQFGDIAKEISRKQPLTNFQIGLKDFSVFLLRVSIVIATMVVIGNVLLNRSVIESVLFALALSVGLTPQLLPAIVSTALALGSRELNKKGIVVKRLLSIEDLGDLDVLITDKTGTLTSGEVKFDSSFSVSELDPIEYGLLATNGNYAEFRETLAGLTSLDQSLWLSNRDIFPSNANKISEITFDHSRRISSVLVEINGNRILISKGAPEDIIKRSNNIDAAINSLLDSLFHQGLRVIAVAYKSMGSVDQITVKDEEELNLIGFLTFSDPPKPEIEKAIFNLKNLNIEIKIATGDSLEVSKNICKKIGLNISGTLTGNEIDQLTDTEFNKKVMESNIFARVSPEQKARILLAIKKSGKSVGFLGDGVNDAIALHDADVGISVQSATDVAKDAADVVLLEKNLDVLANGIRLGRRVFNNTMKYIFMTTSADFGNMFSASIGSLLLPFFPMAPTQVLLQDLLYDSSQLAIPTDHVDSEQILKPSHWNIRMIRKFMTIFGLISSIFDFITFGILFWYLDAEVNEFQTGWFIESLATATLIVLIIRTRRTPFFRSAPSLILVSTIIGINIFGFLLTISPFASNLGFVALPLNFYLALALILISYIILIEIAKWKLFTSQ